MSSTFYAFMRTQGAPMRPTLVKIIGKIYEDHIDTQEGKRYIAENANLDDFLYSDVLFCIIDPQTNTISPYILPDFKADPRMHPEILDSVESVSRMLEEEIKDIKGALETLRSYTQKGEYTRALKYISKMSNSKKDDLIREEIRKAFSSKDFGESDEEKRSVYHIDISAMAEQPTYITLKVAIGNKSVRVRGLYDTGSAVNLIDESFAPKLGIRTDKGTRVIISGVSGRDIECKAVKADFEYLGNTIADIIVVFPNLTRTVGAPAIWRKKLIDAFKHQYGVRLID